jgi:perosamine synthetase
MLVGEIEKARPYRDGGFDKDYDMTHPGLNYRMTNLQAAIGFAQLERIDVLASQRQANADFYRQELEGQGRWLFVAKVPNPAQVQMALKAQGFDSRPVFKPLHLTSAFRQDGKFKRAVEHWETGLCLPTGPHLERKEQEHIIGIVRESLDI